MTHQTRQYTNADYLHCEALVNQAWHFDAVFQPQKLAALAKKIYTNGSTLESTYRTVAEIDGQVAGFIFGMNEFSYKQKLHLKYRISLLLRLLTLKNSTPTKKALLLAIAEHEKARSVIVEKQRSEIILFVVDSAHQGKGIGKALWAGFLEHCESADVATIFVETNKKGASSFYENIGFEHVADFHSPLHEFATPNGTACIYKYDC